MANVPYSTPVSEFGTKKEILMFPDGYECFPNTFDPDDAAAVSVSDRKIIKAGTIWPTNDAQAKGVVFNDVDVTDGSASGAVLFVGTVRVSRLPATPTAEARTALPRVTFFDNVV